MQNRTDFIGISLGERLKHAADQNRRLLGLAASAVLSAVFSGSYLLGGIAPFGVAFAAAVPLEYSTPAIFGALVGYLWAPHQAGMQYIAAVLLLGGVRWTLGTGSMWRRLPYAAPAAAGGSMLVGSLAVAFALGLSPYLVAMALAVSMLAAGSAYFFARTMRILENRVSTAYQNELACLYVTFLLAAAALGHLEFLGLSLGRVAAVTAVLLFAFAGGEAGGALLGTGAGAVALAMGRETSFLMGSYAIGGLIAGMFARLGRVPMALAFLVMSSLAGVASPSASMLRIAVAENILACMVFLVLPGQLINFVRPGIHSPAEDIAAERMVLRRKMERFAAALREIGETTRQVSQKLSEMGRCNIEGVWQQAANEVCTGCSRRYRCWQADYNQTMDAVNSSMDLLRKQGRVESSDLPAHFIQRCRKPEEFASGLTAGYTRYIAELGGRRKVSQIRRVVTDQFEGLAMLTDELSQRWDAIRSRDQKLEEKVQKVLEEAGMEPSFVCCHFDEEERLTVEAEVNPLKLPRLNPSALALDIGDAVQRDMERPTVQTAQGHAYLLLAERAVYTVDWGSAQLTESGSRITGDAFRCFPDGQGSFVMVLSDGMGSGGNAAVDSAMTSDLLRRLLEAGVGYDAALKIVNSALLLKSGEETLATVDVAGIDLHSGRANFYKAGAAPTFVVKNGRAGYVQSDSLPAGIIEGVAFEKSGLTLREGDRVVLVSDGVTATGADWVKSQLEAGAKLSAQELADNLAATARERQLDGREDDITVLVADLLQGE